VYQITEQFTYQYDRGGMAAVSASVESCYVESRGDQSALRACMLYDNAVYDFEQNANLPAAKGFLDPVCFWARMLDYSAITFGSIDSEIEYFGHAPGVIARVVMRQGEP